MRKAVALTWVLIPLLMLTLSGCGRKGAKEKQPFSLDYERNAESARFFIDNDDINMLMASTPFYTGTRRLPSEKTTEYYGSRAKKVDEIIAETDALVQAARKIKPQLDKLRGAYFDYMTVCVNAEPNIENFARYSTGELMSLQVRETVAESMYDSITFDKIDNPFVKTSMQFLKVQKGNQLGALYMEDTEDILAFAAMALESLKNNKNPRIQEAGRKVDAAMGGFDGMRDDLQGMVESVLKINNGFKQLTTADYYFSRAATEYMTSQIPDLKEKMSTVKPNAQISQEDIDFINSYLAGFENLNKEMAAYLDSVDTRKLVDVSRSPKSIVSPAYALAKPLPPIGQSGNPAAAVATNYSNAVAATASPMEPLVPASEPPEDPVGFGGVLKNGWRLAKQAAHGAQSVVGAGLDAAGVAAHNISTLGLGIYNGTSWKDIRDDMQNLTQVVADNWRNNMSGSATLQTAKSYFGAVETGTGELVGGVVKSAIGEGWTSWGAGKIAQMTVGLFTGLGKGIVTISNRSATTTDYVLGTLDIVASAIGGSKIAIKATQLPGLIKGLGEGSWLTIRTAASYIDRGLNAAKAARLENQLAQILATQGAAAVTKAELQIMAARGLQAALGTTIAASKARLSQLLAAATAAAKESSAKTFKDSVRDFVKAQTIDTLGQVIEFLGTVTGATIGDYLDNLVGSQLDDLIKGGIGAAIGGAPEPEELLGVWIGTTVITDVRVGDLPQSARDQGCNEALIQQIKALRGQSMPTYLRFSGEPSGRGTATLQLTMKGQQGRPTPLAYVYAKSGQIEMTYTERDAKTVYRGAVRRVQKPEPPEGQVGEEDSYAMSGKMTITSGTFLYIAGDWNVEK